MVGSEGVWVWRESGVRRSVLCWCICHESSFNRREDVFIIDLFFKDILYVNVLSMRFEKIILQ
jgi:hypothetical protein